MAEGLDNIALSDVLQIFVASNVLDLRPAERSEVAYIERHGTVFSTMETRYMNLLVMESMDISVGVPIEGCVSATISVLRGRQDVIVYSLSLRRRRTGGNLGKGRGE